MSAAQLDFYYDMDDDLGLVRDPQPSQYPDYMYQTGTQSYVSDVRTQYSDMRYVNDRTAAAGYTTDSRTTSYTPYSNPSGNASSTSVDDSPRSTQLLTQPIPMAVTPTTALSSSTLTTPTSTLTSPPSSATYPLPSAPRKRSVEFISHEISNTSGVPLVLSQPPKRGAKRHVSDVGHHASEPIYYYSNLVSPATESYDEYGFDHVSQSHVSPTTHVPISQSSHVSPTTHVSSNIPWNPSYTLPSQKSYRERHNSDYTYDYGYDVRRVSESGSSRKASETSSTGSDHVATSGFINYTQRDGPKLMTGVAPSGAQKTKQKREAEARRREQERREKEKGYY